MICQSWLGSPHKIERESEKVVGFPAIDNTMSLQGNEEIRAFMDKLTATTDVSKYIDLPMIAVMGDTSSGKSSLLSSLSAVELPSASELTTRCPIMLQMKLRQR